MSDEKKNKEQGVETPTLVDNQETAHDAGAFLGKELKEFEAILLEKDSKILELEEVIKSRDSEIKKLEKKIDKPKGVVAKKDQVVIRFLLSPAGKFKLPYNVGQEVAMDKEVAAEVVESRYAEYVK